MDKKYVLVNAIKVNTETIFTNADIMSVVRR